MQRLRQTSFTNKLILVLIPCLVFSYLPVVLLGKTAGMSIELSFLYVITALTVVAGFLTTRTSDLRPFLHNASWILLGSFIIYLFTSLLWTPNPVRGMITSLFFCMLFGLVTLFASKQSLLTNNWLIIRKTLLFALLLLSGWGMWQLVGDVFRLPSVFTGLPMMYSGDVFGVARPTGFALEPQFFGSLLLIPLLWSLYHLLAESPRRFALLVYVISTLMLFMTLSRGALAAAAIGGILLLLVVRPTFRRLLSAAGLTLASIIGFILLVFCFATFRVDSISGNDAAKRVISQLSLGTVTFPAPTDQHILPKESPTSNQTTRLPSTPQGYVAESTNSRLSMSEQALALWRQSPVTVLFGVGVGGFGTSLYATNQHFPVSSVVNNYYLELLVETGLFGALLFGGFVITLLITLLKKHLFLPAIILTALLIQMAFFSGNANIIHLWVLVGFCIGLVSMSQKTVLPSSRLLQ